MGRRAHKAELEFGSDSFLDVICNIVGILIILIVVVAVKVERQPLAQAEALKNAALAEPVSPDREAEYAQRQTELDDLKQLQSRMTAQLQELSDRKESLTAEHGRVVAQINALQDQLAAENADARRHKAVLTEAEEEAEQLSADVNRLLNILSGKEKALKNAITVIQQEEEVAVAAEEKLRQSIVETTRLQEVLEDTPKPADNSPRRVHRIMPVSRRTDGKEIMFRLSEGKVSEVRIHELMEQAVDRIKKRISMLQRTGRLEDIVGPLGGYKMSFAIEINAFNSLEYLQYGGDGSKFNSFTQVVIPDETLIAEPVEIAVRPGSAFRQKLDSMPIDSAVTIVVYEDSFKEFTLLREVAHGLQIRVAARPLPVGTSITISANGSASRAQ
jgi:hypothetical protein